MLSFFDKETNMIYICQVCTFLLVTYLKYSIIDNQ